MTKMIKVTCPSCKKPLNVPEQQLRDTDGRVDCRHCAHTFRLVKKKKTENKPTEAPKKDIFADVGLKDPIFPTSDFPTGEKNASKINPKKAQPKLNYREPKAESKNHFFSNAGEKPFAFNMLDAETANANIPQVSIKPANNSPSALTTGSAEQQNNITIHTDSLVFTLVGENANENGGVIDSNGNKSNAPIMVTSANDLNWTIATIGALIVLIVQLFYLVMMML